VKERKSRVDILGDVKENFLKKNQGVGDRDMKMECFFSSIRFWQGKVKHHFLAIVLILSVSLAVYVYPISGGTLPQSFTILYSNNINGEIDPCPS
jgi:hypothetical protein